MLEKLKLVEARYLEMAEEHPDGFGFGGFCEFVFPVLSQTVFCLLLG